MNHTQQLDLIDEAYHNLPEMVDGFKDVAEFLFEMNVEGEHRHRKGTPGGYPGLSVAAAARYFAVKQLLDGWREPDHYTVDDIVNVRNEVLYAQAYAKRFNKQLQSWAIQYGCQIDQLDYSKLVK
jgi:hypothetical protein